MTKITITLEDASDGVLIIGDPSMQQLMEKAQQLYRGEPLSIAENMAVAAWTAILQRAREIGDVQAGERH